MINKADNWRNSKSHKDETTQESGEVKEQTRNKTNKRTSAKMQTKKESNDGNNHLSKQLSIFIQAGVYGSKVSTNYWPQ